MPNPFSKRQKSVSLQALRRRRLFVEPLEDRRLLAADWFNYLDPGDVNNDGLVAPVDALLIINELNTGRSRALPPLPKGVDPPSYFDTSNDDLISPVDVLLVINAINSGVPLVNSIADVELLQADSSGENSVVLAFSDALLARSIKPEHFTLSYCLYDAECPGEQIPLEIVDASLHADGEKVLLTTALQQTSAEYYVSSRNLATAEGEAVDDEVGKATFLNALPRVVGAISTSNTSIVVSFSEPMETTRSLNPLNYKVIREDHDAGHVIITAAQLTLPGDRTAVTLTTMSQSEVPYQLHVVNMMDDQGHGLAPPANLNAFDPSRASFRGTPFLGPLPVDTDGDGLSDDEEQRGWVARYRLVDGTVVEYDVTSDPLVANTDGDGFADNAEKALRLDPRDWDTDGDRLEDEREYNHLFGNPAHQDTDGDGIDDFFEHNDLRTSALLTDTDGDGFDDAYEIITDNRNARIADLPQLEIELGNVDLRLDVRFDEQTAEGTTTIDNRTVATTLEQSQQSLTSQDESTTNEDFWRMSGEVCAGTACAGADGNPFGGFTVGSEGGAGTSKTMAFSSESSRSAQREHATSLSTDNAVSTESIVTRIVHGATLGVEVSFVNTGNIAFTLSQVEITALVQDPRNPTVFVPVATLFPASEQPISIGPLTPKRGPFRFTTKEAFPSLVESLMENPRGMIFKVANKELNDEFGRNFAFVEQDVNDRTAYLEINYAGNLPLEKHRVATGNEFDDNGKPSGISFQETLRDILGLEFIPEEEDIALEAKEDKTREDFERLDNSYSTRVNKTTGVETLHRVRGVSSVLSDPNRIWWVRTPAGLITPVSDSPGRDFHSVVDVPTAHGLPVDSAMSERCLENCLYSGESFAFEFIQDLDNDGLTARMEAIYGSIDSDEYDEAAKKFVSADTDGDGIDDGEEVLGDPIDRRAMWTIQPEAQDAYQSFANPARADTDLDGLTDCQELARCPIQVWLDPDGLPTTSQPPADQQNSYEFKGSLTLKRFTDPSKADTDGDGLTDLREVAGFLYTTLEALTTNPGATPRLILPDFPSSETATNPWNQDTDSDGLNDFREIQLGTDPTKPDGDSVNDDDGDGLVNLAESNGWSYDVVLVDGAGEIVDSTFRSISDPNDPDSDDDGLTDWEEFMGCRDRDRNLECDTDKRFGSTDARRRDTDSDGLSDREEVDSVEFVSDKETPFRFTDPLHYDSDRDGRSDGVEVNTPIVVRVAGKAVKEVYSDPNDKDADGDGLFDASESLYGSDPTNPDTDGDGALDKLELDRNFACLSDTSCRGGTNLLKPDRWVTVVYHTLGIAVNGGGDANSDGDAGSDPGDFQIQLGVSMPWGDGSLRRENLWDITQLSLLPGGFLNASTQRLQFAVAETELFTLEGVVREKDGVQSDVTYLFGGLGSPGEFTGQLSVGTFGVVFEGEPIGLLSGFKVPIKITAQIIVE